MLLDLPGVESLEPDRKGQCRDAQQQGRRETNGRSQDCQRCRHDQQNDDPSPDARVEATPIALVPSDRGTDEGKDNRCEDEAYRGPTKLEEPDQDSQGRPQR